jgi:pyruvate/2-oxoglutarate/acetoin dehydrogenase E1 component
LNYFDAIREGQKILADHPKTLFVGQSVRYEGHALFKTMQTEECGDIVPYDKRIELPVIEDFQMGYSTGLALAGFIPVSIFPRWDFLLLAANQLVNHLDKIPLVGNFKPKVIVRTTVGAKFPLNSGWQHTQDHTAAFRLMLKTVKVLEIGSKWDALPVYREALACDGSVLIVEKQDLFNE